MTVYRILVRYGLMTPKARKRRRDEYLRWERPEPMQLWQMDIVGGVRVQPQLVGPAIHEIRSPSHPGELVSPCGRRAGTTPRRVRRLPLRRAPRRSTFEH